MSTTTAFTNPFDQQGLTNKTLLDLNTLLRKSLKGHDAMVKEQSIIIRCESLPEVEGDEKKLGELFDQLLTMIFSFQPHGPKFFLYVDCQEQVENIQANDKACKWYQILFHTNISSDASWKEANRHRLLQCEEILHAHGGNLGVNTIQNTGCLFVISLPGKKE